MMELSDDDLAILRELQRNSRASYSKVSKSTGIPQSTVHDKIKKLREKGVIKQYSIILDDAKIGQGDIAIIGVETGAKLYKDVAENLCQLDEVVEVYGTTAEFDLMLKIRATSRERLAQLLSEIRRIEGVEDIFVTSVLEVFKQDYTLPI